MRKACVFLGMLLSLCVALCSCAPLVDVQSVQTQSVYATFFPYYALTEPLLDGVDGARLSCLVQPQDGCLRAYSLSDWDAFLLQSADVVISGGLGLESFESTLQSLGDDGPVVALTNYNYMDIYQGVSSDETAEDSHFDGSNPHLYMCVEGAKYIAEGAALALCETLSSQSQAIMENLDALLSRLDALGEQMQATAAEASGGRVILLNEAMIYLARELGLEVAGQYEREVGEAFYESDRDALLEALEPMDASVVLVEQQAPAALKELLRAEGYEVAQIDVMTTLRADMGAEAYFSAQKQNAQAIADAFAKTEEQH